MKHGLHIARIWADDDLVEFRVGVGDGTSWFLIQVYVGYAELAESVAALHAFKSQVHGGLFDLRFGEFGPEYAGGAFHARFHFAEPGRLQVSCRQESEFFEFAEKQVAGAATMYLRSEPALLDRLISELAAIAAGTSEDAFLEAI